MKRLQFLFIAFFCIIRATKAQNSMTVKFIIRKAIIAMLVLSGISANAQIVEDLGEVWSKTYNIVPHGQIQGFYPQPLYHAATGQSRYIIAGTTAPRVGYLAVLDESGTILNEWNIPIPAYYNRYSVRPANFYTGAIHTEFVDYVKRFYGDTITIPPDVLISSLSSAVMKTDGSIIAFGSVHRYAAQNWTEGGADNDFSPGSHISFRIKDGIWVVKIDANGNVGNIEKRRGTEAGPLLIYDDKLLLSGIDIHESGYIGAAGRGVGMLHEYNLNGDFVTERCPVSMDGTPITAARKHPNGSIILDGWIGSAALINSNNYSITRNFDASAVNPSARNYPMSGTGTVDGGMYFNPQFSTTAIIRTGSTFAKFNADGTLAYRVINKPTNRDTAYSAPLVLNHLTEEYVGSINTNGTNKIYTIKDNHTGYSTKIGSPYPNNTELAGVSFQDGFFSMSTSETNNVRTFNLSKLSVCANFKLNVGTESVTLMSGATFPGRNVSHSGNNGTVTYSWMLTDITPGGNAIDGWSAITKSGTTNILPAQQFSFAPGKNYALLQYTITALDSYLNNAVPQTCQQTYNIQVKVQYLPDNISDAECFVTPASTIWGIIAQGSSAAIVDEARPWLVGDLDGNGISEIVAVDYRNPALANDAHNRLIVFPDGDLSNPVTINTVNYGAYNFISMIGLVRVNNKGLIVVPGTDGYLHAYEYPSGARAWTSSPNRYIWNNTVNVTNINREAPTIGFVDFNNDGIPELYVGNRIFNAATGAFLCAGGSTNNKGFSIQNDPNTGGALSVAVDIDGDGKPELIAGNQTYKITENSGAWSMSVWKTITPPRLSNNVQIVNDGHVSIADLNNDGHVDAIISVIQNLVNNENATAVLWGWDIYNNEILFRHHIMGETAAISVPFIGDIDGDGKLEILSLYNTNLRALKLPLSFNRDSTLSRFWTINYIDEAWGRTGITLFDFNQDGKAELVYRDQDKLRIINGSLKSHITGNDTTAVYNLAEFPSTSPTTWEMPIVVDIDNDGSAEIVCAGGHRMYIYKGPANSPWAPARKVWNQYAYNAVNVNNDLTIPPFQFNPASPLPGVDSIIGTPDDVYPYNAFLQQQTLLNKNGMPLWLAARPGIVNKPALTYDANTDSMTVNIKIENLGEVALHNPFYISVYCGQTAIGTPIMTYSYPGAIPVNDTVTITFGIGKYTTKCSKSAGITILINDNGDGFDDQVVCNYGNRDWKSGVPLLAAENDTIPTYENNTVTYDILKNDSLGACSAGSLNEFLIVDSAKHGFAEIINDGLRYIPNPDFIGHDTIKYYIRCDSGRSEAYVFIKVHNKPDNIVDNTNCFILAPSFDFTVKPQFEIYNEGNQYTIALVGDLDGDGLPEIVGYRGESVFNNISRVAIFNGQNGTVKATINIGANIYGTGGWCPAMTGVIVDADANGMGELMLVDPVNRKIIKYEADTTGGTFKMNAIWSTPTPFDAIGTENAPQPIVADLNGDGVPELIVFNKIYNAVTGTYLGQTEVTASAYVGRVASRGGNTSSNFIAVADFDGDGIQEIAAGGKVYKVAFNANGTVSCSTWRHNTSIIDGFTAIADVDLDGDLDVVSASVVSSVTRVNVWTPLTNTLIDQFNIAGSTIYQSYPFVGDIDGNTGGNTDRYPEICVVTYLKVNAYKYNPATKKYGTKWTLTTTDSSGGTGITLFDFNNDGIQELVYRDETQLRILNGAADVLEPKLALLPGAKPGFPNGSAFTCYSGTAFEYPVIADTDGDGSANICVTCAATNSGTRHPEYLRVYESATDPWAPTRTVWNQVSYDILQINEDLTVPSFPIPKNTIFNSKYPYNGALIQVPTMVNTDFSVVMLAADPAINKIWLEQLNLTTMRVWVRIDNLGSKNTNAFLPVALYETNPLPTPPDNSHIAIKQVGTNIIPGDSFDMFFDIPIAGMPNELSVRIQDDGEKYPADGSFLDCNYGNNEGFISSLLAIDDRFNVFKDSIDNVLDVIVNDFTPSDCANPMVVILTNPGEGPNHGSAVMGAGSDANKILYTPVADYVGYDTLRYRIYCSSDPSKTDTATVYINVIPKPDNISDANCYTKPPETIWDIERKRLSSVPVHYLATPFVGDLDGDGRLEVIAPGVSAGSNPVNQILIFNDVLQLIRTITLPVSTTAPQYNTTNLLIADVDNNGYGEIIIATSNRTLLCYSHLGVLKWGPTAAYTAIASDCPSLIVSDINGDGYSEILAVDKIYDGATGTLLLTLPAGGRGYSAGGPSSYMPVFADIDNDGIQEAIAGNTVYKINIISRTNATLNSATILAQMQASFPDGFTSVADIDMDGDLDVIVTAGTSGDRAVMYVWDGATATQIGNTINISTRINRISRAFAGDITGTGRPDIAFTYVERIVAYSYNNVANTFVPIFSEPTTDTSGATTMSMFDFNQDGEVELVYRDETNLRIIDKTGKNIASFPCYSATHTEYPVIVDLDKDGHADILVTGGISNYSDNQTYIMHFGSKTPNQWASARSVWNQHAYNAVNINENLTAPRYQLNPATVFPGLDGVLGTADDVRPFNNFLQQQTMLSKDGGPLWITPDAEVDPSISNISFSGNSVTITVGFINTGDAAIGSPVHATVYNNNISIASDSANIIVQPNDTGYVSITITDITTVYPIPINLVVRINDKDGLFPVQLECEYDNNEITFINPLLSKNMEKKATLISPPLANFTHPGTYPNPVSILSNDTIIYEITAINANLQTGDMIIRDTVPAHLEFVTGTNTNDGGSFNSGSTSIGFVTHDTLTWTFNGLLPLTSKTVSFKATPVSGIVASQPLFINHAWITVSDTLKVSTNSTFHQGTGVSVATFSAGFGGSIFNAEEQALDYRATPRSGILIIPEEGFRFEGWSHNGYTSLRGIEIKPQSGIMLYDTLVIYGNVELTANFVIEEYPVRYRLNGGRNAKDNPSVYTIKSGAMTLEAPEKEGDTFIGWSGSNGDEPQLNVVIQAGTTGEIEFYANYLHSGRESDTDVIKPVEDKLWASGSELYVRTSKPGSVVRIYSTDGKLLKIHVIVSPGESKIKITAGIYAVTLNEDIKYILRIK